MVEGRGDPDITPSAAANYLLQKISWTGGNQTRDCRRVSTTGLPRRVSRTGIKRQCEQFSSAPDISTFLNVCLSVQIVKRVLFFDNIFRAFEKLVFYVFCKVTRKHSLYCLLFVQVIHVSKNVQRISS